MKGCMKTGKCQVTALITSAMTANMMENGSIIYLRGKESIYSMTKSSMMVNDMRDKSMEKVY